MRHQYHPKASAELGAAVDWYEEQLPGLGLDFFLAIEATVELATKVPNSARPWPCSKADIRQRRVKRFPYLVVYFTEEDLLNIVAVMHTRRRPDYWLDRLQ